MKVGELWVQLGVRRDSSWTQSTGWINGLKGAALGMAGWFGVKGLGKSLIGFNSELEAARLQMASMMAIVKGTSLSKELNEASLAVDSLYNRAIKVPGTFEDLLKVEKQIALPVLKAGHSMKELEDIAVATAAAMQIKDVDAGTASRSIMRIYEGTALARDRVTQFIAQLNGVTVKQLRDLGKLANAGDVTAKKRLRAMMTEFATSKYIADFQAAKNKSVSGQIEEFSERSKRFLGKVGESLFKALGPTLTRINKWLEENPAKVEAFATRAGEAIAKVFTFIVDVVEWLINHKDLVVEVFETIAAIIGGALLVNTLKFIKAWGPLFLVANALLKLFKFLQDEVGTLGAIIGTAFAGVAIAKMTGLVKDLTGGLLGAGSAANSAAGSLGGMVNQLGLLAMAMGALKALEAIKTMKDTGDPTAGLDLFDTFVPGAELFGLTDDARQAVKDEKINRGVDRQTRMGLAQKGGSLDPKNIKYLFGDGVTRGLDREATKFDTMGFAEQFAIYEQYKSKLDADIAAKGKTVQADIKNNVTITVNSAKEAQDVAAGMSGQLTESTLRHAQDAVGGD